MSRRIVLDGPVFLSTSLPTRADRALAFAVIAVSLVIFLGFVPYAREPLPPQWTFIPIYDSAITFADLMTAAILFIQFDILRSRALLALACGYLFTASIAVAHELTFPGLFSPTGLLGAGSQSTAWLYVFWHGGFPLAIICYATLKDRSEPRCPEEVHKRTMLFSICGVIAVVSTLTLLATSGEAWLPVIMRDSVHKTALTVVLSVDMTLGAIALTMLWWRLRSVLDLWLIVVMCAWLFDVALGALLNHGRFDLGFYAGRVYGLCSASFVLVVLLYESATLYGQLAESYGIERARRKSETAKLRVSEASLVEHKDRERLFVAAVQSSVDAIVTKTLDGTITGWNLAAERLFGYSATEVIGKTIEVIVPDERRAELRDILERIGRGEIVDHHETIRRTKSGKIIEVSLSISPIESPEGAVIGACKIARDVSEKKRIERMKDEFIATVSHELRTPVTTIAGPLGLLAGGAAGELPAPVKRLVAMAHGNSVRLMHLVNEILDIEKIESGRMAFCFARVELLPLIERAVAVNRPLAEKFGVAVRLDARDADIAVRTDAERLIQAIANLLSNAVKFSPAGEEVVVSVEPRGDDVRIAVRDHGPGVPEEYDSLIYQKFAQVDATDARQKGGNGLGLSIAKQTVIRLGGSVGHTAIAGGGTIFYIDVPRWPEELQAAIFSVPLLAST